MARHSVKSTPIYVDLDGTLVRSDTLWESVLGLVKKRPWLIFVIPLWLVQGRAAFKERVGRSFIPSPKSLPYNEELLAYLRAERASGRPLILATAATDTLAAAIACHLGIFERVLASSKETNLKGPAKLQAIQEDSQGGPFAYAGDSGADKLIWQKAAEVILAGRAPDLKEIRPTKEFRQQEDLFREAIRAIRPQQWAKNILLFASLVLAHKVNDSQLFLRCLTAWAAFSLTASAIYLLNDLLDLEADRHHPTKRRRPLAAGTLPLGWAAAAIPLLLGGGLLISSGMPTPFRLTLVLYGVTSALYSLILKRLVLLDVIVLALLYTVRIIAGSAAIEVSTTPWLLGFSLFIFMSLALAKRYSELINNPSQDTRGRVRGRGYQAEDVEQLAIFGSASAYISVLVLALYINSAASSALYGNPQFLWLICVVLIYWISRVWLLTRRGQLQEDPLLFTIRDPVSYLVGITTVILLILAT